MYLDQGNRKIRRLYQGGEGGRVEGCGEVLSKPMERIMMSEPRNHHTFAMEVWLPSKPTTVWMTIDPSWDELPGTLTLWELDLLSIMLKRTLDKVNRQRTKIALERGLPVS
jgi:hypothetical protein